MRASVRFILVAIISSILAEGAEADGRYRLVPHNHGEGNLYIRQDKDKNQVLVDLTLTAQDVVRFETEAASKDQKNRIEKAISTLQEGSKIFLFNKEADCRFSKAEVVHHRAYRKDAVTGEEKSHADFRGKYEFICIFRDKVRDMTLKIDNLFPTVKKVIYHKQPASIELSAKSGWKIKLRP